jgi:CheY-like chemotaxis protein
MSKVMLVEDDNNLREIYEARLAAEGYTIISAKDGEEALALAVKERPDLIISDVMMPKISGFDMLDILRSTPEVKNTKVIMMTALGQAEDRARADKLGADRYLVKSQVTLEDVVKVAHEVLADDDGASVAPLTADPTAAAAALSAAPATDAAAPAVVPVAVPVVEAPAEPAVTPTAAAAATAVPDLPMPAPTPAPELVMPEPTPAPAPTAGPVNDQAEPEVTETATVEKQIQDFIANGGGASNTTTPANSTDSPALDAPGTTTIPVTVPSTDSDGTDLTQPAITVSSDDTNKPSEAPETEMPVNHTEVSSSHQRVLQPTSDILAPSVDLNDLLAKEEAKSGEAPAAPATDSVIHPAGSSTGEPAEPAGFADKPTEDFDAPSGAPSNPNNPTASDGAPDPNQVAL